MDFSDQISIPSLYLVLVSIGIEGQCESWGAHRPNILGIFDLLAFLSDTCLLHHSNSQHLSSALSAKACLGLFSTVGWNNGT